MCVCEKVLQEVNIFLQYLLWQDGNKAAVEIRLNTELKKTGEIKEEQVDGGKQLPIMVSLWKQVVANAASLTVNLRI